VAETWEIFTVEFNPLDKSIRKNGWINHFTSQGCYTGEIKEFLAQKYDLNSITEIYGHFLIKQLLNNSWEPYAIDRSGYHIQFCFRRKVSS
jgi:hypothetical protein